MPKCDFNKATLLKSHFAMGVLMQICCIFSEHAFSKTHLKGCFSTLQIIGCGIFFPIYLYLNNDIM